MIGDRHQRTDRIQSALWFSPCARRWSLCLHHHHHCCLTVVVVIDTQPDPDSDVCYNHIATQSVRRRQQFLMSFHSTATSGRRPDQEIISQWGAAKRRRTPSDFQWLKAGGAHQQQKSAIPVSCSDCLSHLSYAACPTTGIDHRPHSVHQQNTDCEEGQAAADTDWLRRRH